MSKSVQEPGTDVGSARHRLAGSVAFRLGTPQDLGSGHFLDMSVLAGLGWRYGSPDLLIRGEVRTGSILVLGYFSISTDSFGFDPQSKLPRVALTMDDESTNNTNLLTLYSAFPSSNQYWDLPSYHRQTLASDSEFFHPQKMRIDSQGQIHWVYRVLWDDTLWYLQAN